MTLTVQTISLHHEIGKTWLNYFSYTQKNDGEHVPINVLLNTAGYVIRYNYLLQIQQYMLAQHHAAESKSLPEESREVIMINGKLMYNSNYVSSPYDASVNAPRAWILQHVNNEYSNFLLPKLYQNEQELRVSQVSIRDVIKRVATTYNCFGKHFISIPFFIFRQV